MPTRREFLKWTAAGGAGLVVGARAPERAGVGGAGRVGGREPDAVSGSDADYSPITPSTRPAVRRRLNLSTALIRRKLHSQLPETPLFGYLGGPETTAGRTSGR